MVARTLRQLLRRPTVSYNIVLVSRCVLVEEVWIDTDYGLPPTASYPAAGPAGAARPAHAARAAAAVAALNVPAAPAGRRSLEPVSHLEAARLRQRSVQN